MSTLMREAEAWKPKMDDENSVVDDEGNRLADNAHSMMNKLREMKENARNFD